MTYYLWIHPNETKFDFSNTRSSWCHYELPEEGYRLISNNGWNWANWPDPLSSGVLADWLDDHKSALLLRSYPSINAPQFAFPSTPAEALDRLINHLRQRFHSHFG